MDTFHFPSSSDTYRQWCKELQIDGMRFTPQAEFSPEYPDGRIKFILQMGPDMDNQQYDKIVKRFIRKTPAEWEKDGEQFIRGVLVKGVR